MPYQSISDLATRICARSARDTLRASKGSRGVDVDNGDEIQVREILFAPGWQAPRHYHNSDLFIYVISGEFEVDMEGEGLKTYTDGQALRMKPNTPMDARNPSQTKSLKLAVFQVGNPDAPFVVPIEQED